MKKYKCMVCGWIYDEAIGSSKEGIAPGTKWEDVPSDWVCPDCGVSKDQFDMIEI
ncbi:Rubredoxin [Bathymodiolus thermophilus thioautotrophic gill symbiont]|uniref:rubredoxin n=1 Tax=Bathymodiolus thermophilus thioautotrophic gill symbiont TaxID=2360 RepID=UPI0010B6A0E6|nr:rubredoxin [Bathymodiolus thermophilus thioautotrophic gill symbiont]SGZ98206.1 Rubredoxin [Bathymodiolus thermophilus thioautotrophic gill symbiont]